jgi:hypothetical protein
VAEITSESSGGSVRDREATAVCRDRRVSGERISTGRVRELTRNRPPTLGSSRLTLDESGA